MKMSNQVYDVLKIVALLILPVCELISSIACAMGYDASIIIAILTAFHTFLGSVLKISSDNYAKEQTINE